jgi:hypothetical protein
MKIALTILSLVLTTTVSLSQDTILKKTGEEISARVLEVGNAEIVYKEFSNQEGPLLTLLKSDIFMIRYQNGAKDLFTEDATSEVAYSAEELSLNGQRHAMMNYTGEKSGAGWTIATTVLLTPLVGAIPAIACSSTKPSAQNLKYRDDEMMADPNYRAAYFEQAHKIKRKKVWRSFAIGSGAWLLLVLIL